MSAEEVGRRQRRRFNRSFLGVFLFGCVVLFGIAKLDTPSTTSVSSNIDGVPMVTRTLVPRDTTTTTARPSSAVSIDPETDELILIDGSRVYRLPRTPAVMLALYIATAVSR